MSKQPPVFSLKIGQMELCKWAGMYDDKPTYSYTLKKSKFNKTTKKEEDSPFFTLTNLKDIAVACRIAINRYYEEANQPRPKTDSPQQDTPQAQDPWS